MPGWGPGEDLQSHLIIYYRSSSSLPLLTNVFHDLDPSPYLSDLLEAELGVEDLQDDVEDSVQDGDQGHRDAVDGVGPHVHQVLGEGLDLVVLSETLIHCLLFNCLV